MGPRQAACSGARGSMPGGCTALLQLLLLAALPAALAADVAYYVNSMACPSGTNITYVNTTTDPDLFLVYNTTGPGKTYVLAPGSYVLSKQIQLNTDMQAVAASTTCFVGGGARAEVVVTATGIPSGTATFSWVSSAPGPAISLGLKGLILDNGDNAAGVYVGGDSTAWSIEDVTIRNGRGALYSIDVSTSELANTTVEHIVGTAFSGVYHYAPASVNQWRDLAVTDCASQVSAVYIDHTDVTIGGIAYLARNRASGGGALSIAGGQVNFTGDVVIEGNEATGGGGGGAYIYDAAVRFTKTLLVQNNVARRNSGGGGFVLQNCTVSILGRSSFINNTADDVGLVGGAVYMTQSRMDLGGSVCIQQNSAANGPGGSGLYLEYGSTIAFTSPADAQMGDNTPADSSILVEADSSWNCTGSGVTRGPGNYSVQGPVCGACTNTAGGACSCPATSPFWIPAACACRVCEPGSGPCCSATAQYAPCTRSLVFVPDNIISPACDGVELLVIVADAAPTTDPSVPKAQPTETAPAVDVPVVFSVSGDCEPSLQARTVRTDAQGRARVRVTAQGPGVAAVTAAVTSGGSLRRPVVLATSHIKFLPCHRAAREHAYDAPDDDNKDDYGRRADNYDTRRARPYAADDDDGTLAEAFEAVATQMALQAVEEHEASQAAVSGGGTV